MHPTSSSASGKSNPYRSHLCGELRQKDRDTTVRLSGWVHRKRDHGSLLFIDLRDHAGMTQCVFNPGTQAFAEAEAVSLESVITVVGKVLERTADTVNAKLATGEIEILVESVTVQSPASPLPLQVNNDAEFPEKTRLAYRFLDLRRERLHRNIMLRSQIIDALRREMVAQGFTEYQTPILTSSSPEGARDYVVPSRLYPGSFYALPQSPQQFKQLLMVAGFDRYFQIAPCFRDEDARADRSPGEFYQLDLEMAFVTQEDVFAAVEPVLHNVFEAFAEGRAVTPAPFPRIPYDEAMLIYGTDKPDLRNPLRISDVTEVFRGSGFALFAQAVEKDCVVRAIPAPGAAARPRSFFDHLNTWAREQGAAGLGYVIWQDGAAKGPIAKLLTEAQLGELQRQANVQEGDALFFVCARRQDAEKWAGFTRKKLGEDLGLLEKDSFRFCWIVDFPMYELDENTQKVIFSHNPFSMPQGGMEALLTQDPLTIKAYQYDIVCNGVELCSGAIRNHLPDVMIKAFEIAGYEKEDVEARFGGLLNAFRFGAPPHGGAAPGVDRMVMLLTGEENLREVVAFPMNQQAQDLLMQAPSSIPEAHLKELHLKVVPPLGKVLESVTGKGGSPDGQA
ncbi:MAG: aspartate--tRNA ligase [Alphaproteobacteria bacterium]